MTDKPRTVHASKAQRGGGADVSSGGVRAIRERLAAITGRLAADRRPPHHPRRLYGRLADRYAGD